MFKDYLLYFVFLLNNNYEGEFQLVLFKNSYILYDMNRKNELTILLANPRGFCAGVERAIEIVEKSLEKYGAPVYVRHEIVHNKYVIESLKAKGAIFVDELDKVPDDRPVVFSAHGVPKSVPLEAQNRNMVYVDATCPLVSKVHREAENHHKKGRHIIMIGHKGHPEVIGTMGQLPVGEVTLVEDIGDVEDLKNNPDIAGKELSYVTQTTLSIDDSLEIINELKARFPNICEPKKEDICYATTNRQEAVKKIAEKSDLIFVVGSPNSSNSNRLKETAVKYGCAKSYLVENDSKIDLNQLDGVQILGITAGASAPEILIDNIIAKIKTKFEVTIEILNIGDENVKFKLPNILKA